MSVINQDDFLGRIDHLLDSDGQVKVDMEEQRQIEAYQQLEQQQAITPVNEWGVINHKQYRANLRWLTLHRNDRLCNKVVKHSSQRGWKKVLKRNIVIGELTEFLFEHLVGMTSEPQAAFHDPLHAESSRFYIKDMVTFTQEVPLTNKKGSPTARFVTCQYIDRIGNVLPYQDWRLRITDGKKVTILELPFSNDDRVNNYIDQLLLAREEGGWVVK